MPQQHNVQQAQKEARLALSKQAIQTRRISSCKKAAAVYDVPRSTLRDRIKGALPQAARSAQRRKLYQLEEQALVQWILELDQRGFPPQIIDVRRMADHLLAARGQTPPPVPVGKNWVDRFIKAQPELQTKWNRRFHAQRALCEDPEAINAWFKRVEDARLSHGIADADIYNFDETGFAMGVAATSKVVTSSDTIGRRATIQPGNREWVTAIECINASGWSIPPFVILPGKVHQAAWYQGLPADWMLAVSDNGWTTDQLGLAWLQHFDRSTRSRVVGTYRLLIVDGHSSHTTPEFDTYCTENKIVTLCMPAHTSHLLQPLDVSCFSPLKRAYGQGVQELARQGVHHIDKLDFLSLYTRARALALTEQTIKSGFQATGLIPADPSRVLSSLTVINKTPSPPSTPYEQAWVSETPHTTAQLEQQARLIKQLVQRQSQSPTSQAINQLVKGCQIAINSAVILARENRELRATSQRRKQKQDVRRRYIAQGGALQAQAGQQLVEQLDNVVSEVVASEGSPAHQRAPPTCTKCHIQGHTRRQCTSS
jgi:hypothetical protein